LNAYYIAAIASSGMNDVLINPQRACLRDL